MPTIINVHPDWIISQVQTSGSSDDGIAVADAKPYFPQLHYYAMKCSELPFPYDKTTLICGGSYNIYLDTPLFKERCLILEDLYFPYDINSKYIKVRYGALLWPQINLDAYTYLLDPQRVFLKKHNKFIAEFRFYKNRIELYECIL